MSVRDQDAHEVILPIQPHPISTHVGHIGPYTAIARLFRPDDVARCRLCPRCVAGPHGLCLVEAIGHVTDAEAPLYRLNSGPGTKQRRAAEG